MSHLNNMYVRTSCMHVHVYNMYQIAVFCYVHKVTLYMHVHYYFASTLRGSVFMD